MNMLIFRKHNVLEHSGDMHRVITISNVPVFWFRINQIFWIIFVFGRCRHSLAVRYERHVLLHCYSIFWWFWKVWTMIKLMKVIWYTDPRFRAYHCSIPLISPFGIFFDFARVTIKTFQPYSYLIAITACNLQWHLSNLKFDYSEKKKTEEKISK